jgi:hypothetical protein
MSLHRRWLCVCLFIAAASCGHPPSAASPTNTDGSHSTSQPLKEGVAGQITDANGKAIAEATVLAAALDPNGPAIPEIAIVSDESGRYQWPLRPGRYALTVVADGYERVSRRVALSAGEVATLDFLLPRSR